MLSKGQADLRWRNKDSISSESSGLRSRPGLWVEGRYYFTGKFSGIIWGSNLYL